MKLSLVDKLDKAISVRNKLAKNKAVAKEFAESKAAGDKLSKRKSVSHKRGIASCQIKQAKIKAVTYTESNAATRQTNKTEKDVTYKLAQGQMPQGKLTKMGTQSFFNVPTW